jgi:hypothetical protein
MDYFSHEAHVEPIVDLSYDRGTGEVNISKKAKKNSSSVIGGGRKLIYSDLYFEHSDTCPSRRNRILAT